MKLLRHIYRTRAVYVESLDVIRNIAVTPYKKS